jgi:type II secretory pathway pseudopilin PulG
MNNSRTILVVVFLMVGTLLTTAVTTMVPAAYADNKQKAEDDSAASIADCDDNEVEQARFDCIAIAANDVEIEPPEESATLSVCKEVTGGTGGGTFPEDFAFTVTGNNPSPAQFRGDNIDGCVDVTIGPGEYTVSEVSPPLGGRTLTVSIESDSDCVQDRINRLPVTGEIQAGETQECRFINSFGD